jgi:hypothetical protein
MAIENLKKHLIFSTFNFYYSFLAIFGEQKTMLTLYPCVHGLDGWMDRWWGVRARPTLVDEKKICARFGQFQGPTSVNPASSSSSSSCEFHPSCTSP